MTTTTTPVLLRNRVPSYEVTLWQDKVDTANRKAARVGLPAPFALEVLGTSERTVTVDDHGYPLVAERTVRMTEILITGEQVGLPGWRFVASVAWDPNAGPVVNTVPGYDGPMLGAPEHQRCDHCGTSRRRNDTYLVQDPEGVVRQVGSDCLTAYTGIPLGWVSAMKAMSEEIEGGFFARPVAPEYEVRSLLRLAVLIVDSEGYVSSQAGDANRWTTRQTFGILWHGLGPKPTRREVERRDDIVARIVASRRPTEAVDHEVEEILAWTAAQTPRSDYVANLQQILTAPTGLVSERSLGYAVSAVSAYRRHLGFVAERKAKAERVHANVAYIGKIKQRVTIEVEVERVVDLPDYGFGPSDLFILREVGTGSKAVWKTGSLSDTTEALHRVRQDDGQTGTVTIKATVKSHQESKYNGEPETTLTRVALA
jgi:hypothetical protein